MRCINWAWNGVTPREALKGEEGLIARRKQEILEYGGAYFNTTFTQPLLSPFSPKTKKQGGGERGRLLEKGGWNFKFWPIRGALIRGGEDLRYFELHPVCASHLPRKANPPCVNERVLQLVSKSHGSAPDTEIIIKIIKNLFNSK